MPRTKTIALVAHDHRKQDLAEWVAFNYGTLSAHRIVCTGTTGRLIEAVMEAEAERSGLEAPRHPVTKLRSGPLGGDQQLGAMITEGRIDVFVFFWDPMQPQPHDVDVKALLRIAVVYNVPIACNRATADYLVSSPLLGEDYSPVLKDYSDYLERKLD
ncbi:MAG TPA: methylglyoxal synthase [Candidatus Krumholzibacteria bacterium]|nr:methylglyoxal synthase [Candidatus Krumholzibacteria bacterium]HRX52640.1 methylglyoxal synthase [Candidatus Krumholzibacteria bacterium]